MNNLKLPQERLEISLVDPTILNNAPYNPRKWSKEQTQKLKEGLLRYGFVDPLVVNGAETRKNIVIGGNFRLKVAKDLGYESVPVVFVDIPDIELEKELNLRLNKSSGDWDFELLKDFGFDLLKDVGFDNLELEKIFEQDKEIKEDDFDVESEVNKITTPTTKTGDIIQLGNHRLICGDSTDPKVLEKLLQGEKIDMIYNDPIYNINYKYCQGMGEKNKYGCVEVNDDRSLGEYQNFLETVLKNSLPYLQKDAHIFHYCDQNYIGVIQEMYRKNGITNRRVAIWLKNSMNPVPLVAFSKSYEPCVYGTIGSPYLSESHQNLNEIINKNIGNGNKTFQDLNEFFDVWMVKRDPTMSYSHPTQKPLDLAEKPLKRCTKLGDCVLDAFGGSGSTLLSCEQLGRRAFLVEKEPAFCDIIIKRFNHFKEHGKKS